MVRWTVFFVALLSSACDSGSRTSDLVGVDIYALLSAVSNGSGSTSITAQFKTGGITSDSYIDLTASDRLFVSSTPIDWTLDSNNLFVEALEISNTVTEMREPWSRAWDAPPEYFAELPVGANNPIYVSLTRGGANSLDSQILMPPPFQITAPASDTTISRSGDIVLLWSDSGTEHPMSVDIGGQCLDGSQIEKTLSLIDSGSVTITPTDISPDDPTTTCVITVSVTRVRLGAVSAPFAGGYYQGTERRNVTFTSVP